MQLSIARLDKCKKKNHLLLLSYHKEEENHNIKSIKRVFSKLLPREIKTKVVYSCRKLNAYFNIKDSSISKGLVPEVATRGVLRKAFSQNISGRLLLLL